jgi:hypothetical protein
MPSSRKKNLNTGRSRVVSDNDGETIDITNVSDTSVSVDGSQQAPQAAVSTVIDTPVTVQVVPANNPPVAIALLAPLLPSAPTSRTNRAHDIDYFFTRGSKTEGTSTICKPCR